MDADEENRLVAFRDRFALTQLELDRQGAYSKVVKAAVLRDLMSGILPTRAKIEGQVPFNFQKNEQVIWLFNGVDYLEDNTRTEHVGRSSGVSIRVAKGVYCRVGAFRGHPVSRTARVHVDTGMMAVTNKHLYFGGGRKSLSPLCKDCELHSLLRWCWNNTRRRQRQATGFRNGRRVVHVQPAG